MGNGRFAKGPRHLPLRNFRGARPIRFLVCEGLLAILIDVTDEQQSNSARSGEDVLTWNLAIIEALADGVHPMTGEDLEGASIFNDEIVRRALNAARAAMQKEGKREARRASLPKKAGRPWSEEEDSVLVERFEAGMGFAELANLHGRTDGAIRSRLTKLGKLIPEH